MEQMQLRHRDSCEFNHLKLTQQAHKASVIAKYGSIEGCLIPVRSFIDGVDEESLILTTILS